MLQNELVLGIVQEANAMMAAPNNTLVLTVRGASCLGTAPRSTTWIVRRAGVVARKGKLVGPVSCALAPQRFISAPHWFDIVKVLGAYPRVR